LTGERGQKEPIEIYIGADGRYQLKKGWRRMTALRQLFQETGEDGFATALARIETGTGARIDRKPSALISVVLCSC